VCHPRVSVQCSQDTIYSGCAELLISFRVNKDAPDEVAAYFSHSVENSDTVALTRGGLILIALLAGGDYDSGVPGIGAVIAYGLARCGFGDTLIDAARDQDQTGFRNFLDGWRQDLRLELSTNARGLLGRRYDRLVPHITDTFPSLVILKHYLHPITSGSNANERSAAPWRPREPALRLITSFCTEHLGWDINTGILKRFHANLWDGVCFRMLCMVSFICFLSHVG
jgi:Holliday junction resolvase YEN1